MSDDAKASNPIQRFLNLASDIKPHEIRITFASFFLVFILMAAYYILRPVRDAMASDWSDVEVSFLWTLTFFFSVITVSLYTSFISRVRYKQLVPYVYAFFSLSFLLFYLGTQLSTDSVLLDKSFYVWISVFSLFHISVFWSLMSDIFSKPQATRLFGFIGAGASVGAIVGPSIPAFLASNIGTDNLLLIASLLLLLTIPLSIWLQNLKLSDLAVDSKLDNKTDLSKQSDFIGGNPFSGFNDFLKSPYLIMIAVFILFYTSISSFIYFELKNLLADYDRETRTQIWSSMDLVVNTLTVLVAAFATGRMAKRFGLSFTLASVPVLIAAGLLLLAFAPIVGVVIAVQVIRRSGNYAVTRPAREMLFTVVNRQVRFKTKPVIDIIIYRGGDMLNAWAFTALTQGFGLSLAAVAGVGAVIALLWAVSGIYLGRKFNQFPA